MEKDEILKSDIDEVLFKFLQSIYLFEKRETSLFNINWDEVYLLQLLLRNPGLPVAEIAKMLRVKDFVASRMITRLCNDGLLERNGSTGDRRVVRVFITEGGKQKIKEIEAYNYETIAKQFDKISADEIKTHMKYIGKLGEFLGLE